MSVPSSQSNTSSDHQYEGKPLLQEVLPKLRNFQREALEFATQGIVSDRQWKADAASAQNTHAAHPQGRLLLADEMGLGKTVTALAIASYYEAEWPLLILCPASLRYTWPAEIEKFFPSLSPQAVHVVAGFSDVTFLQRLGKDIKVVVCTYSLFQNRSAIAQSLQSSAETEHPPFRVVICDESHNLKEKSSQRAALILPLIQRSKRLLMLSGTPALAKPVELWTQVFALNPDLFGLHSYYIKKFCNPTKKRIGRGRFIMDYSGSSNEAELHSKLRQVMVRRLKADVLSELPPKQRTVVPVTIAPSEKEACKTAMKLLQESSRDGSGRSSVQEALEQQQPYGANSGSGSSNNFHSSIMQAFQATGIGKAQAVVDYLMDFLAGSDDQKILIFAHHKKVMDHIDAALCRKSPKTVQHMRIDGSVPAAVRAQLVRQFQTNSRIRVGLLSMTAAGVGLTLTAASTVLFAELHWTPGVLAQAEDRAHRIGSTASCIQIVYMVSRDSALSLDSMLWRMLGKKIGTLGQIVDGKKEQPYLHAAKEEQKAAKNAPGRSVQEEVSDFFASSSSAGQNDKIAQKIPVKGSIESFFKPRSTAATTSSSKNPTPASKNNSTSRPSSTVKMTPAATTQGAEGRAYATNAPTDIFGKCSICSSESMDCLCKNLFQSGREKSSEKATKSTPRSKTNMVTKTPKAAANSIEWSCTSCTFINCKSVNAHTYYTCEMCHSAYTPDVSNTLSTPHQQTSMSLSQDQRAVPISMTGSEQKLAKTNRLASPFNTRHDGPEAIIIDDSPEPKARRPRHLSTTPQVIEIEDDIVSAETTSGKKIEARSNLLEFRVSPNTGRVGVFYSSTKESANVNFDLNEVVTSATSDELLKLSTTRGSGHRFESSSISFNDDNVVVVVTQLKDVQAPGMQRRYGKDLKEFISSYLVLGEAEKKAVRDAGVPFSPGNLGLAVLRQSSFPNGKCVDRYVGGAKERARENSEEGIASANDEAVLCGNACAWCGSNLSRAQKKASATYCTQKCAEEGRLKRGGQYASSNLRSAMFAIEGGVCTICNVAAHELFKQIKALQPAQRLNKLLHVGWKLPTSGKAMGNILNEPKEGDFWQVDHIAAVAEGGGGCGIENLRTLCVPCHQSETEKLRTRLKLASPIKKGTDDDLGGVSNKKRKQLDIRESFFLTNLKYKS